MIDINVVTNGLIGRFLDAVVIQRRCGLELLAYEPYPNLDRAHSFLWILCLTGHVNSPCKQDVLNRV